MTSTIERIEEDSTRPVAMTAVARSVGLYPAAREIWTRHPVLEEVSNSISMHLGTALPGRDGSLLKDCLKDAIAGYRSAETDRIDPVIAYVKALVRRATDVFDMEVIAEVPGGKIAWDPLLESLREFASRYFEFPLTITKQLHDTSDEVEGESELLLGIRLLPEYVARFLVRTVIARNATATSECHG